MFNRTFISGSSLEIPGIYNELALVLLIASQGLDTYSKIQAIYSMISHIERT